MPIFIEINQSMQISPINFYLPIFITLLFKKILFPQWNFKYEDLNSIELFILLFTFIYTIHLLVKLYTLKKVIHNLSLFITISFSAFIIYNNLYLDDEILSRTILNHQEEIIIKSKDAKYCLEDLSTCTDSIKVTKYKLLQKSEIL